MAPSSKCNLECLNCESASERDDGEASFKQLDYIIRQAKTLNIFHVVIIGKGEPFYNESCKSNLFKLIKKFWELNFFLFTNGTTLTENDIVKMKNLTNLFTLVSIEGLEEMNDIRRGAGVYQKVIDTFEKMQSHNLLYGYTTMVWKNNYRHVLSDHSFYDSLRVCVSSHSVAGTKFLILLTDLDPFHPGIYIT